MPQAFWSVSMGGVAALQAVLEAEVDAVGEGAGEAGAVEPDVLAQEVVDAAQGVEVAAAGAGEVEAHQDDVVADRLVAAVLLVDQVEEVGVDARRPG